jgi:transcriptional regulator with XRE-family HTH domain
MPLPSAPPRPDRQTLSRIDTGALIRDARRYAGLTQAELATKLGTTQSAISNWERGIDTPRVDTLGRILKACGFEADLELRFRADVDRSQVRRSAAQTAAQRARSFTSLATAAKVARRAHEVPSGA